MFVVLRQLTNHLIYLVLWCKKMVFWDELQLLIKLIIQGMFSFLQLLRNLKSLQQKKPYQFINLNNEIIAIKNDLFYTRNMGKKCKHYANLFNFSNKGKLLREVHVCIHSSIYVYSLLVLCSIVVVTQYSTIKRTFTFQKSSLGILYSFGLVLLRDDEFYTS